MVMTVDIGGTKTMRALWDGGKMIEKKSYATGSIKNFDLFLEEHTRSGKIQALSFALAGPVTENRFALTNADLTFDLSRIKEKFSHIPRIFFLNDLEALGYAIPYLASDQLVALRKQIGRPGTGAKAVVSVGTGLGIAAISREGTVIPSEGGHVDFAPVNPIQNSILAQLQQQYETVSYEHLVSGQGISNIYKSLTGNNASSPAYITKAAFSGENEAKQTIEIFIQILAAVCANMALTFAATGGIYLAGGIIPKILPMLDWKIFEDSFLRKGKRHKWLQSVPVMAVLDETAPSLGAFLYSQKYL